MLGIFSQANRLLEGLDMGTALGFLAGIVAAFLVVAFLAWLARLANSGTSGLGDGSYTPASDHTDNSNVDIYTHDHYTGGV